MAEAWYQQVMAGDSEAVFLVLSLSTGVSATGGSTTARCSLFGLIICNDDISLS